MPTETETRRDRIEQVSTASADENRLVTVAVAPDDGVGAMHEEIEEADARAEYLDEDISEPHREALQQARRILADYDETPDNGLVIYTGVVDGDLVEYVFDDLPAPVPESTREHDNEFDTDPLEVATGATDSYGLLVVERGGAAIGISEGADVTAFETFDSDVPGKTRAGGQSAARFERRREQQKEEFFADVASTAEREFLDSDGSLDIDGLFLGGTAVTVESFRDGDYLDHRLADLLIDTFHVQYASEQGLRQLAEKARAESLEEHREARDALDEFFAALHDEDEPVVYGPEKTDTALTYDAVETLLVSERRSAENVQSLRERVEQEGGDYVTIPTDIDRGEQFAEAFGGVGALLRFPIE